MGEIPARDAPMLDAVLNQKAGQGCLNEAVLIPVRMVVDEVAHRPQQRRRHLGPQAHHTRLTSNRLACERLPRQRPVHQIPRPSANSSPHAAGAVKGAAGGRAHGHPTLRSQL
jgi:hypothetical protein